MTKTSAVHKVRFLEICLAVKHVVSSYGVAMKAQKYRATFGDLPLPSWTNMQCWEFATGSPQNRKSATAEQTFSLRICDTQI